MVDVQAHASGHLHRLDARGVGIASKMLGSGRKTKEDRVDHAVGIVLNRKVGDRVLEEETLATLYTDGDPQKIAGALERFRKACHIGDGPVTPPPLLYARVTPEGVDEYAADHQSTPGDR